ncbi:MAG: PorP/SprF family type IX secretion system membrane protein [Saprospiraceae bacterium]|nr:PorP/SprF family type IX secretion system membrane protein [Saprospiraceae bacterium]
MKKLFLFILLFQFCFLYAQDRHYSQFYASPLTLNPALTGAYNAKYRVAGIYRNQWSGALPQPYTTYGADVDVRFRMPTTARSKDAVAAGIYFVKDNVSGIDFINNQMGLSLAYHKALDYKSTQYLSVGLQGSLNQRNVNYEKLMFQDQFNGINGYTIPTQEVLPENNFSYGDLNLGVNYTVSVGKKTQFFVGGAYHHILRPQVSFFARDENNKDKNFPANKLFSKFSAHTSANISFSETFSISPRVLAQLQGPHLETTVGNNFRFYFSNGDKTAFTVGAWARASKNADGVSLDAIVGLLGIEFNNIVIGASYDTYISNVQTLKNGSGAFEVSIQYLGDFEDEDGVLCPTF